MDEIQKVICILGPTATGKTDIALELSEILPVKIISVDSAMIYRGMDIGTSKPSTLTLDKYPHGLIDILDPIETYSVGRFLVDVQVEIQQAFKEKLIPLLVGGTMMYFNALQKGIAKLPTGNQEMRDKLVGQAKEIGWEEMHKKLSEFDEVSYTKIKSTDTHRTLRALEVYYLTGTPISEFITVKPEYDFDLKYFGILPTDREQLHANITARATHMLASGFVEEVTALREKNDLSLELPSMKSVGYRQIWEFLDNEYSYNEMQAKLIAATRQLAKRQMAWLRKWDDISLCDNASRLKAKILSYIEV